MRSRSRTPLIRTTSSCVARASAPRQTPPASRWTQPSSEDKSSAGSLSLFEPQRPQSARRKAEKGRRELAFFIFCLAQWENGNLNLGGYGGISLGSGRSFGCGGY